MMGKNAHSKPDFKELLLSSSSLTSHITSTSSLSHQLPRALDSIQAQSRALLGPDKTVSASSSRLRHLDKLLQSSAALSLAPVAHVVFDQAQENQTEEIILACIEESRQAAVDAKYVSFFINSKVFLSWIKRWNRPGKNKRSGFIQSLDSSNLVRGGMSSLRRSSFRPAPQLRHQPGLLLKHSK